MNLFMYGHPNSIIDDNALVHGSDNPGSIPALYADFLFPCEAILSLKEDLPTEIVCKLYQLILYY